MKEFKEFLEGRIKDLNAACEQVVSNFNKTAGARDEAMHLLAQLVKFESETKSELKEVVAEVIEQVA